jgi:hypothetical protein
MEQVLQVEEKANRQANKHTRKKQQNNEENRTEKQMKRAKCNHVHAKPAKQIPSRI